MLLLPLLTMIMIMKTSKKWSMQRPRRDCLVADSMSHRIRKFEAEISSIHTHSRKRIVYRKSCWHFRTQFKVKDVIFCVTTSSCLRNWFFLSPFTLVWLRAADLHKLKLFNFSLAPKIANKTWSVYNERNKQGSCHRNSYKWPGRGIIYEHPLNIIVPLLPRFLEQPAIQPTQTKQMEEDGNFLRP